MSKLGLLFDYSGVLTSNLFTGYADFSLDVGLGPHVLPDLLDHDPEGHRWLLAVERGQLSQQEFERRVGQRLGIDGTSLVRRVWSYLRPDERMLTLADRARRHDIRTGILSNSLGLQPFNPYLQEGLTRRFDVMVISGDVGMRKPDPAIFALALERIDTRAERCVFIDDMQHNVDAATSLGIRAILHHDTSATVKKAEELLQMH